MPCPHMAEGQENQILCEASLIFKTLKPTKKLSCPNHLLKVLSLNIIVLTIKFQHLNLEGDIFNHTTDHSAYMAKSSTLLGDQT